MAQDVLHGMSNLKPHAATGATESHGVSLSPSLPLSPSPLCGKSNEVQALLTFATTWLRRHPHSPVDYSTVGPTTAALTTQAVRSAQMYYVLRAQRKLNSD